MEINITNVLLWLIRIIVILFAITIHEYAHGRAALFIGDPTAKNAGRLTLNPLKHLDPVGTVFLFLFFFGWAKPVPINPRYFSNRRRDTMVISLSGPISNLAAAFIVGLFIRYIDMNMAVFQIFMLYMLLINIGLGLFNLLPIPPLDGSHVIESLLPDSSLDKYYRISRYAPAMFMGFLFFDYFFKLHIFSKILSTPLYKIAELFSGENFL
jgi:Zn-dependent protease